MEKEKKLNPSEEELDNDSLNPDEEDFDEEDLKFLDEDEELEEKSEDKPVDALDAYNKEMQKRGLNKNFKSWDDVAKSVKQADIKFAQKPKDMEEEKKVEIEKEVPAVAATITAPTMSERMLKFEHPESAFVIEEIKRDHPGKDVLEVFESSGYYQKEATVRSENEQAQTRISNPSGGAEGEAKKENEFKQFLNPDRLPPGFSFGKKK